MNDSLTPKAIVRALDEHIVGQQDAKRAVAVALRNRWRRQRLSPALRDEVSPKNILMIGPTGCGKSAMSAAMSNRSRAIWPKKRSGWKRRAAAKPCAKRRARRRWIAC